MRIYKSIAMLFGAVVLITGLNSCNKDDDIKCCTFSYTYDGSTYSYEACENGTLTYSLDGDVVDKYSWKDDYGSWKEVKDIFLDYGANCN